MYVQIRSHVPETEVWWAAWANRWATVLYTSPKHHPSYFDLCKWVKIIQIFEPLFSTDHIEQTSCIQVRELLTATVYRAQQLVYTVQCWAWDGMRDKQADRQAGRYLVMAWWQGKINPPLSPLPHLVHRAENKQQKRGGLAFSICTRTQKKR